MAEAVRSYMDQHFPRPASEGLRRHGLDILTTQDAGNCGLSGQAQLAFAALEGRAIATFDPDFLALHQASIQHAGIVWCPAQKYSIGQLIQALLLVHGVLDADAMRNHAEYL